MTTQMPSSLEIAQEARLRPISEIAAAAGLEPDEVDLYGRYKAKVDLSVLDRLAGRADAKLVSVTAITPTKAGEGKTTTAVSLTQGLGHIGRKPVLCLREASLGPVFGIKGGAAGAGYAQVVPMEDLNLHFTGDIHAIGAANNLLAAMLEASILHGNPLGIDPLAISWRRCMDMNDRALRNIVVGLGGRANGYVRETGFDITAASEVMAIVAVARDLQDLRARLGAITVGTTLRRQARDGRAAQGRRLDDGAAQGDDQAEPRPDARGPAGVRPLRPVREHRPRQQLARVRPGRAQARRHRHHRERLRLRHGHGEVLRHRLPGRRPAPSAIVLVASIKALKHHGGDPEGGADVIERGAANLIRHLGIIREFGLNAVVAVNRFPDDKDEEIELVRTIALADGAFAAEPNDGVVKGGEGAAALAEAVVAATEQPSSFAPLYPLEDSIESKIETIARRVYGADGVFLLPRRTRKIAPIQRGRLRPAPDLHGEDASLPLARPGAHERADRLHGAGPRHPRLHRGRLARRALRRHADDAGARQDAGRVNVDIDDAGRTVGLF